MKHLDLFSGIGGFTLAAGWVWGDDYETVGFVDNDSYCQALLKLRFPNVPIHGDIKTYKGKRSSADLITGGFPCQPFSAAGKREGTEDDRHLWPEMLRIIKEVQPTWVVGENVSGFTTWNDGMVFDEVLSDLENAGYETASVMVPASAINAPHRRDRIWIVAHNTSKRSGTRRPERKGQKRNPTPISESGDAANTTNESVGGLGLERKQNKETAEPSKPSGDAYDASIERHGKKGKVSTRRNGFVGSGGDAPNTGRKRRGERRSQGVRSASTEPKREDTRDARSKGDASNAEVGGARLEGRKVGQEREFVSYDWDANWAEVAAELCRVDDGLPARLDGYQLTKPRHRMERLKGLGNAIVPQVAYQIMSAIKEIE